ncbi:hypothetical protein NE683_02085 [Bariatricus massiliensis]|uniref:Uncharacterized protein n=3 Tax=Bariatricus massiliensis TaxID=1745713 RepID=A0ABS8DM77_9FIRM|nr:hypothetical protein [Bariatricus massiliensis]MCB7303134.1 hypothetical protein [Bariatricus massiliensis]MCB7376895.1 hypothetical protein [Bariatricus massiliensis]MCB7389571.1 hypothetical protein [Bariatricus massiliensis]MCQ5252008.1 hypothetical protein [Bariatricus massiliensis]
MDKNNLSVQASLDTSQLKKDLEKFKGEIKLNTNTKNLKKQVTTALKDITVQPSLDTSQIKKDLKNFNGEVRLNADTKNLSKQLETTIANASQNATANIHCGLSGMDTVMAQLRNATASNHDIKLNVSADTSRLQQYTSQLEKLAQLSSQIQLPKINTTAMQIEASLPKASSTIPSSVAAPASSIKEANTESRSFLDTLNQIISVANTPLSLVGPGGITERYQNWGKNILENLD